MSPRLRLAALLPFLALALALQGLLWPWISPFVWCLFFPGLLLGAHLGGFRGGLARTLLFATLVWYVFIPPCFSWTRDPPPNLYWVGLFLVLGYLFSEIWKRLECAHRETAQALEETRAVYDRSPVTGESAAHDADSSQSDPPSLIRPQMPETLRPDPVPQDASHAPADAPLVLVIEDAPDMRASIAAALGPKYRMATAHDGPAGLEQALALRPDLILCDVTMPGLSGDALVLRRHPELTDVPIVMLTAQADEALRVRLLRGGVQDCISRPCAMGELLARVDGLVASARRTAERLCASEGRFEASFEQAAVGMALVTPDGRWLRVNRKLCRILGYSPAELLARPLQDLSHPDELEADLGQVRRLLAGEIATYAMEKRATRKDGSGVWLHLTVTLVRRGDGRPDYFSSVIEDIQRRKTAEAEVHRLNTDLERRVAERTAELTAANQELDSFAYAVSHDLRAPLRAMSGFSQALQEDYGNRLPGEARRYLEQIVLASQRMGGLIDGLLALSHNTRGELRHDALDLSALAERLLAELARGEPARHVRVQVQAGLQAYGDTRMLEVVLRNLLGNAWKYTGHREAAAIRVYAEERAGRRWFYVADNGAGFDPAHAPKLFQPFQRLHRQDEFPGLGIGLATVQRIVHRHGGILEAQGEPGQGATFCFSLGTMDPPRPAVGR